MAGIGFSGLDLGGCRVDPATRTQLERVDAWLRQASKYFNLLVTQTSDTSGSTPVSTPPSVFPIIDCQYIWWATASTVPLASRLAGFRYCSTAGGWQWDVASSVKMTLTTGGKLGVGAVPLSQLDVSGGAAIGSYAGVSAAPANGLIVSGQVGICTASPITSPRNQFLDVRGPVAVNTTVVNSTEHLVTIGANDGEGAIIIVPASGTTTARPTLQMWKDTTPTRAMNIGIALPGSGGALDDLLISRFINGSGWAGIGRWFNATGHLTLMTHATASSITDLALQGVLQVRPQSKDICVNMIGTSIGADSDACPLIAWYKDAAGSIKWSLGMNTFSSGFKYTIQNDLLVGRFDGSNWSEAARFVNATGDFLLGTTTDSARLTVTGASDATAILGTSGTLTTTGRVAFDLASTWNNASGTFTGLRFRATNTNSTVGSMLFDFGVGSSSVINCTRVGALVINATPTTSSNGVEVNAALPVGDSHTGYYWRGTSASALTGASAYGMYFDFSPLAGSATNIFGSYVNVNTIGLSADTFNGQRILIIPEGGTFTNIVVGQDIQWGDNYSNTLPGANTISTMIGLWIHDSDAGGAWDNGTVCSNGLFGILVSRPAGGGTWHPLTIDGPMQLLNNEYVYWGANQYTDITGSTASIRWRTSNSTFEFETANTARMGLTSAAVFPSTNGGLTLGKDDYAWSEAWFKDTSASHQHRLLFNSSSISGDLTLTFDLNNGSRNIVLKGDINTNVYTPTLFNTTNVAASTAYSCQWLRVGDMITVSGLVDIDPTAGSAATVLGMSLPVASNIGAIEDCAGVACTGDSIYFAAITGDIANDRATFSYTTNAVPDIGNKTFSFTFTYQLI